MTKLCSKCRVHKDDTEFYSDKSKSDKLSSYCKACQRTRSKVRYVEHTEDCRRAANAHYAQNKDRYLEYGRALRTRVLTEYGGECKCCGETTAEFLAIDHVNNDGESHRREIGGYGRSIYRWLEQHAYPKEGFQLLCHNCNMAKGLYGGCPHQGPPPGRRQGTTRWTKAATPAIGDIPR